MPTSHLVLCGGAPLSSHEAGWQALTPIALELGDGREHAHLRVEQLSGRMAADLPPEATDLLEIAAFVYAADRAAPRGGTRSFDYGVRWNRRWRFEVPVRRPDLWRRDDVRSALEGVLGFLSDDLYEFGFCPSAAPRPAADYLFGGWGSPDTGLEEVMLFSGGLDSLGGAVQEILNGQRRVALVSHRPVNVLYSRQRALLAALESRLDGTSLRPLHVAVEVNVGRELDNEHTQRSRSFLFTSMAAVVARALGLSRVRCYENGVLSLHLPISPQVIGGRASRTTHPRVLKGLGRLFSLVFDRDFKVENPFLWKTKADVLEQIRGAGHAGLCALAVSCTHTREMSREHSHCGRCSQCLDRWLGALAAGLADDEDPPGGYRTDVLTTPREQEDMTLIERVVGAAREIRQMGDAGEFATRFPEVGQVLGHLDLPSGEGVRKVFRLYRSHADRVHQALARAVGSRSADVVAQAYPANTLIGVAVGRQPSAGAPDPTPADAYPSRLTLDGSRFEARLGGGRLALGNTLEWRVLERLNQDAGAFVSLEALRRSAWGGRATGKNTIQRTVGNLRRRLREAFPGAVDVEAETGHYRLVVGAGAAVA